MTQNLPHQFIASDTCIWCETTRVEVEDGDAGLCTGGDVTQRVLIDALQKQRDVVTGIDRERCLARINLENIEQRSGVATTMFDGILEALPAEALSLLEDDRERAKSQ